MPELPEVETIARQLNREFLGRRILRVAVGDRRLIKGLTADKFAAGLRGRTIKRVFRRGKVLIAALSGGKFMVMHLRISGWIDCSGASSKAARVTFVLEKEGAFSFCDSRALGEIRLVNDWRTVPLVARMGPEPLEITQKMFLDLFEGKDRVIKPLLLDQEFIAGVGNIYAQEALFCAGIHPRRRTAALKRKQLIKLNDCLQKVLKEAIANKGSSVDTYRQITGARGGHSAKLRVYRRQGKKCFKCGAAIQKETIGGRGTCFCPRCQK